MFIAKILLVILTSNVPFGDGLHFAAYLVVYLKLLSGNKYSEGFAMPGRVQSTWTNDGPYLYPTFHVDVYPF